MNYTLHALSYTKRKPYVFIWYRAHDNISIKDLRCKYKKILHTVYTYTLATCNYNKGSSIIIIRELHVT